MNAKMTTENLTKMLMRFFVASLVAAHLVGCANLSAVREFAKAAGATAGVSEVVSDYSATLERQNFYRPSNVPAIPQELFDRRKAATERLQAAQAVLVEYMKAIEALAANDLPIYNKQLDKLGAALGKVNVLGEKDVKPYTASVNLVTRIFTDTYRQQKLRKLIPASNMAVTNACAILSEQISVDYLESLSTEESRVKSFFAQVAAGASNNEGVLRLGTLHLREKNAAIEERREKAKAAVASYAKIASGHDFLAKNVGKLDFKEVKQQALQYKDDLESVYKALTEKKGDKQ